MDRLHLRNVEIIRIVPGSEGRFVFATYPGWKHEFGFFIDRTGGVKGRTASDNWVALSGETSGIIREKLRAALRE